MFDVRKTLFISSLPLAAVLRSDKALEKIFCNNTIKTQNLMSRASFQVLERRHHNHGPNTGRPAPGVRKRAKKRALIGAKMKKKLLENWL